MAAQDQRLDHHERTAGHRRPRSRLRRVPDIGESPTWLYNDGEQPGKDIAEYRYRLNRARRRAARERLDYLTTVIGTSLPILLADVPRDSTEVLSDAAADQISESVGEIERLMGQTTRRSNRWSPLHRHMSFGQGHDWHDVQEFDWPDVIQNVEAAGRADADPLPVPDRDLGLAAEGQLTGTVTSDLPWGRLDDIGFERLLFDLRRDLQRIRMSSGYNAHGQPTADVTCRASASWRTARGVSGPNE